ncbi:MAG: dihydroorotate dehydrogenase [Nitrospinaceae bacterium]|nr:dihydroorotate dehydrogenase [Nitrospinaceae bacterium]MBT3434962.1 dihydroorotate dehydrogenase [Nitrospinaceae bacterium]MBT3821087.1 dihydroorotate dehydrogenase [Nitrospinaceae bacterium]MBT4094007.1 dihydroorotate dehydrogenase [Nitrospinaceae bacterium]MBT4430203.1 dihydroorotate dehydrogenase [Nitrospinaceae bacterium]
MKNIPEINPPLINASGILSYPEVFLAFEKADAALGGYVTKSVGPDEKPGNENPVVVCPETSAQPVLNSLALPTQSPSDWEADLGETNLSHSKLIVSVYGGTPDDFAKMAQRMTPFADVIEVNLGCPNKMPGEATLMESIGQKPELSGEVIQKIRQVTELPVIAKLSPNSDYLEVAAACMDAGADGLGCGNTLGPGLALDIETRAAILAGTTGGISGPALKPVNLRLTYDCYARFGCPIIGYGGIETWRDVIEYALAGACIFGIGTAFLGKSTSEAATLTKEIWSGVLAYLDGAPLSSLVGGAHRNEEREPARA